MMSRRRSVVGRLVVIATTFGIGATVGAQGAPAANAAGWLDRPFGQYGTATLALPAWSPPAATANRMEAAFIIRSPTVFGAVHATHHRAESATDDGVGYRLDGLTSEGRRDPAFNGGNSATQVLVQRRIG